MTYDVAAVRTHFPQLSGGTAHFDGPGGTQTPDVVAQAIAGALLAPLSNRGRTSQAERNADDIVTSARAAMGDLLGAPPGGIVFGRSMTALTYDFSRALAKGWAPGDEVVVSRLDHDGNIRPWVHAAAAAGATLRWVDFDAETGELTAADVAGVVSERTVLVAVTGASNLVGTRPDLAAIATVVHGMGALFYVDGVHLTAHAPVDFTALGADVYACSPYKFLGPHCGVLAAHPELLESIHPDKLAPASDQIPERFELGTLPYELLAGTTAAVEFLAGLDPAGATGRRERLLASLASLERYEDDLVDDLRSRLAQIDGLVLHGRAQVRTPTVLLSIADRNMADAVDFLAGRGVTAGAGNFYALEASRRLGLADDGALRVGLAPYTDTGDVDRLVAGLQDFALTR